VFKITVFTEQMEALECCHSNKKGQQMVCWPFGLVVPWDGGLVPSIGTELVPQLL